MEKRLKILNIWVDPVSRPEAIRRVEEFLADGTRVRSIFSANPEKNFSVPRDSVLQEVFQSADMLVPDGIGVVWAAKVLHGVKHARLPGVELLEDICSLAVRGRHPIFVYGAQEEINAIAVEKLQERHPGLIVAGRSHGYVREEEMAELIGRINSSRAEVLFLALGSPRQERWFATHRESLKTVRVCQGIGGSLDVIAGMVRRAPETWRRLDAEWLYRLLSEPGRIRRQKVLPVCAARVLAAKVRSFFD